MRLVGCAAFKCGVLAVALLRYIPRNVQSEVIAGQGEGIEDEVRRRKTEVEV